MYVLQWYEPMNDDDLLKQDNVIDEVIQLEFDMKDIDQPLIEGVHLRSQIPSDEPPVEINHGERVRALYIQWLELLLYDQTVLSHLLQAEAEHIQAFLSEDRQFSFHPTRQEIIVFQETVGRVIDSLNEKQRIHIKLLDSSIKLFEQGERAE